VDGIALRCRPHNDHEAKLFFARDEAHGVGVVSEAGQPYLAPQWLAPPNSVQNESPSPKPKARLPIWH
jgi:hypothetical protein